MNTRKDKEQKLTVEDIQWKQLDMPDGTKEEACTMAEAAMFLDVTPPAFTAIRKRTELRLYELGYGSTKYVLKKDLVKLTQARLVDEERVTAEQLLAGAATLLTKVKASHEDVEETEAIAKWLELYQQMKD